MKNFLIYFVFLFALAFFLTNDAWAQRTAGAGHGMRDMVKEERQERIRALKVAYITRELSLSEREAQVFWPVYNKHSELREQKQRAVVQSRTGGGRNGGVMSYSGESVKMLDEPKVALLLQAEHNFHREVLASLKAGVQHPTPGRPMTPVN
jgi:hypothetical protein